MSSRREDVPFARSVRRMPRGQRLLDPADGARPHPRPDAGGRRGRGGGGRGGGGREGGGLSPAPRGGEGGGWGGVAARLTWTITPHPSPLPVGRGEGGDIRHRREFARVGEKLRMPVEVEWA